MLAFMVPEPASEVIGPCMKAPVICSEGLVGASGAKEMPATFRLGPLCVVVTWAALVCSGCAAPCTEPLSARVEVEDGGDALRVDRVWAARSLSGDRTSVGIVLERHTLLVDFDPSTLGRHLSFLPEEGELHEARVNLIRDGVIVCQTERHSAEGGLMVRHIAWNEDGYLSCLEADLRVRFVGCEETLNGQPVSDLTFVAALPAGESP